MCTQKYIQQSSSRTWAVVRLGKDVLNILRRSSRTYCPLDVADTEPSCGAGNEGLTRGSTSNECEERHSHTAAHRPVVKPPALLSAAVSHTPTQQ